jgi:ribosomal protein S18 acetylase RimI-like enzyme
MALLSRDRSPRLASECSQPPAAASRDGSEPAELPSELSLRTADVSDAPCLATFNRTAFPDQPSPLWHARTLAEMMGNRLLYRVVTGAGGNIVAAGGAWIDTFNHNAEMCGFATHPGARRRGCGHALVHALEADLGVIDIDAVYGLARAGRQAASHLLRRASYRWSGTMLGHSRIGSRFEHLQVWCKRLAGHHHDPADTALLTW